MTVKDRSLRILILFPVVMFIKNKMSLFTKSSIIPRIFEFRNKIITDRKQFIMKVELNGVKFGL